MATPDANNTGIDPTLDTSFSHLSMSVQEDEQAPEAAFWLAQDTAFAHQPSTAYAPTHTLPLTTALTAQIHPSESTAAYYQQHYTQDDLTSTCPPLAITAQAGSSSSTPIDPNKPFVCSHCPRAYERKCELDKHVHNHTKRLKCQLCPAGSAQNKDYYRHMWAHHPNEAKEQNLPKEKDQCPVCGYPGRKDNVKRHRDKKNHW
ncbi:hypothetical protein N0V88_006732 [Collariella sp. IMI 366227]|nr:hypothetical protein N0V88_006732 [Collariella sp. IMI 366227]